MMRKYISLVCGAVLLAALAVGCSGSFGFDGKDGGPFADDSNKDNPFKGTTWEDSEDGLTLAFESDTCEITTGTSKSAGIAREAASGTVSYGNYTYTWIANSNGSFTATLKDSSGGVYATFTIDASGAVKGTLRIGTVTYVFEKKDDSTGGGSSGGGTAGEIVDPFTYLILNDSGTVVTGYHKDKIPESIVIPQGVTIINQNAFVQCYAISSVRISDTVTTIGKDAFNHCEGLTDVDIGNGVTEIPDGAFSSCRSLVRVNIGNNVKTIDDGAFYGCLSLTSITIPANVQSIKYNAFAYTPLANITYEGTKTQWNTIAPLINIKGAYVIHCTDGDIAVN